MQSWVFVEAAAAADPPLVSLEEIGRDEVEIQVDLEKWDALALDHRNLLFGMGGPHPKRCDPSRWLGNGSFGHRPGRCHR